MTQFVHVKQKKINFNFKLNMKKIFTTIFKLHAVGIRKISDETSIIPKSQVFTIFGNITWILLKVINDDFRIFFAIELKESQ